jgi:hypothetical protein
MHLEEKYLTQTRMELELLDLLFSIIKNIKVNNENNDNSSINEKLVVSSDDITKG